MMRRGLIVLAAAGMLAVPVAAPAAPPRDAIGIRLLGEGPYLVLRLTPGNTVVREFAVSSTLSRAADIPLLAVRARTVSGDFRTLEGTPDWISLQPSVLHFDAVPPGQLVEQAATVTIAVPSTARAGSPQAAVVAVAPPSAGGNLRVVNRVGLRVYLTIVSASFPWLAVVIVAALGIGVAVSWSVVEYRRRHALSRRRTRVPLPRARLGT